MPITDDEAARRAAEKFARNTTAAKNDLKRGIEENQEKRKVNTASSGEKFADGVREAIANNSFQKGVQKTPATKFGNSITTAVLQKYDENTTASKDKVGQVAKRNRQVSRDALAGVGPRGRAGDPVNETRMLENMRALRQDKLNRISSGG